MSKLPDFKERLRDELFNVYLEKEDDFYCPVTGDFKEDDCNASLKKMGELELMNELFNEYREEIVIRLVSEFVE